MENRSSIPKGYELGLANEIERLLQSGEWAKLNPPIKILTEKFKLGKENTSIADDVEADFYTYDVYDTFLPDVIGVDDENLGELFYDHFVKVKYESITRLRDKLNSEQLDVLKNTSLNKANEFANKRYSECEIDFTVKTLQNKKYEGNSGVFFWNNCINNSQLAIKYAQSQGFVYL